MVLSVILLIVYFNATGLIVSYLSSDSRRVSNDTPTSLPDGLHAIMVHVSAFVDKGLTSGQMLTNHSLKYLVNQTNVSGTQSDYTKRPILWF